MEKTIAMIISQAKNKENAGKIQSNNPKSKCQPQCQQVCKLIALY